MADKNVNKNVGLYCAAASFCVWLVIIFLVVAKLPVKIDTFILLSWPVLPGVIGGYIFYKMDKNGSWD